MLKRLRERAGSEKGFTLIELLVVMLILGILAAIAIPAFLNQKGKANDSQMKVQARSMQTAIETYSTDHNGNYNGPPAPTVATLQGIEPTITGGAGSAVVAGTTTYTVTSPQASGTNNVFSIQRTAAGTFIRDCGVVTVGTNRGQGGCSATATNGSYW
jgi:type IV pilus assembly protein PilA